jgi:hypothetical protein
VRLWSADSVTKEIRCVAVGYGHSHTVMAVALSRYGEDVSMKLLIQLKVYCARTHLV